MIAPLLPEHYNAIYKLCNNAFGENYTSLKVISNYYNSPKHLGLVWLENKVVAGFLFMDVLSPKELISTVLADKEYFNNLYSVYQHIGVIKQIVVSLKHQHKGIAQNLLKEALSNPKMDLYLGTAWIKKNNTPIKNIFLKNGFHLDRTLFNYWNKDSLLKKYACPVCGEPPCKCSAAVYIKKVH